MPNFLTIPDMWPRAPVHPLLLTFRDPEIEAAYRDAVRERNLRAAQISMRLIVLLNLAFAPVDIFAFQNYGIDVAVWRIVGMSTILGLLLWMLYWPSQRKNWPGILWLAHVFYTCSYLMLAVIGEPVKLYYAGYLLIVMGGFILLPLMFSHGMIIAAQSTAIYLVGLAWFTWLSWHDLALILAQLGTAMVIGGFVGYRQELQRRRDYENLKIIEDERARYRALLTRILPEPVAERLQRGEQVADRFADTSVLFADIVGFTDLSSKRSPDEVVALLNDIFGRFDALVAKHGLEKIKTIGDAYMVAGGVGGLGDDHLQAIAELALDMVDAAAAADSGDVSVRIGIDCGPLAAGVIGDSRFLYDLWGDTVNTASRMESLGAPGRIQVSDTVRQRLGDAYAFEARGKVEVRGKGRMATWFLTGRNQAKAAE
ncbi:MAG: adenylate/guanylate cyclase domain-containing protein [Alphaproteobacteria bacterium]